MIGPPAEARQALTGVIEMLAGKPDFHGRFDVSTRGLLSSFQAAFYAIPFVALNALGQRAIAARTAGELGGGLEPYSNAFVIVRFFADWGYFPLFAALIATLLRRPRGFAPWVVLGNWTHLVVVMAETLQVSMLVLGIQTVGSFIVVMVSSFTVYAAVMTARAALEVGWAIAIPAGCASVATMLLIDMLLFQAL
jgi:hypothetical protein